MIAVISGNPICQTLRQRIKLFFHFLCVKFIFLFLLSVKLVTEALVGIRFLIKACAGYVSPLITLWQSKTFVRLDGVIGNIVNCKFAVRGSSPLLILIVIQLIVVKEKFGFLLSLPRFSVIGDSFPTST